MTYQIIFSAPLPKRTMPIQNYFKVRENTAGEYSIFQYCFLPNSGLMHCLVEVNDRVAPVPEGRELGRPVLSACVVQGQNDTLRINRNLVLSLPCWQLFHHRKVVALPLPQSLIFVEKGIQSEKCNFFICLSDSWIMSLMKLSAEECCHSCGQFFKAYTCSI